MRALDTGVLRVGTDALRPADPPARSRHESR